jgi:hypothetical protein
MARSLFGPVVPELPADTIYTDGAWVPPEFRGRGVMAEAMAQAGAMVRAEHGDAVRSAMTYVPLANPGALRSVRAAGYEVIELRTEMWRLGSCTVSFVPANEKDFDVFGHRGRDGADHVAD